MQGLLDCILRGLSVYLHWDYWVGWLAVCALTMVGGLKRGALHGLFAGVILHSVACAPLLEDPAGGIRWTAITTFLRHHAFWFVGLVAGLSFLSSLIVSEPAAQPGEEPTPDQQHNAQVRAAQRTAIGVVMVLGTLWALSWSAPGGRLASAHASSLLYGAPACLGLFLMSRIAAYFLTMPAFVVALRAGMNRYAARGFVEGPVGWPFTILPLYAYLHWVALHK